MILTGVVVLEGALLVGALLTSLLRRWRAAAGLGTTCILAALARATASAPAEALSLTEVTLWPGVFPSCPILVQMDAPLTLFGRVWATQIADRPWLVFLFGVGAVTSALSLATREEHLPSAILFTLAGCVAVIAAHPPALGLLGAGVALAGLALALQGDRTPGMPAGILLLASGVVGLVALLLAILLLPQGTGPGSSWVGPATLLGLACWLGCPPWGPWTAAACRRSPPLAAGFAMILLPTLALSLLRLEGLLPPDAALLWGGAWAVTLGSLGAWAHRDPRRLWHDLALINLGLTMWGLAQQGAAWPDLADLLLVRAGSLGAVALGMNWLPKGNLAGAARRRPGAMTLTLAGLAVLPGLPPTPGYDLWRTILQTGPTMPDWVNVLAVFGLGAGALGWWQALRQMVSPPPPPSLTRERPAQTVVAVALAALLLLVLLAVPLF